jgi:Tocopherol cyclase
MVTLAAEPGGFARTEIAQEAWADPRGLGVVAGAECASGGGVPGGGVRGGAAGAGRPPLLRADAGGLDVDLGPGARLHARFTARRDWPRRAFGALGPAQLVPRLGQYWTPHLLSAHVTGRARLGERELDLDGATAYAEKNWGASFAGHWWWGQAAFAGGGVAFAGGRLGPIAPTAIAAWTATGLVSLAPPLARTIARAGAGEWRVVARGARHTIALEGEAAGPPLRLPVPVPHARRLAERSEHHLAARLRVSVRRGRRLLLDEESAVAALELPAQRGSTGDPQLRG